MKRSPFLQDLSRDHHTALSLANQIAKAGDEAALAALMKSVPEDFLQKLEPHFRLEEEDLLVRLEAAGETALVRRTLAEHQLLRDLVSRIADGDGTALQPFGIALHDHVRFEERELFIVAEERLNEAPRTD